MSNIRLICPACKSSHEFDLTKGGTVLLLNCPQCKAVLINFHGVTYQVEKSEVRDISRKKNLKSIHTLMEKISRQNSEKEKQPIVLFKPKRLNKSNPVSGVSRTGPVSKDEILNLVIDINTTSSVSEFLRRLS